MALNYIKQTWVDEVEGVQEGTWVDAQHMNHMEEGIKDVSDKVDGLTAADVGAGTFAGKVRGNQTSMAVIGDLQFREIKFTDTAPTIGGQATEPDGTIIIVFE